MYVNCILYSYVIDTSVTSVLLHKNSQILNTVLPFPVRHKTCTTLTAKAVLFIFLQGFQSTNGGTKTQSSDLIRASRKKQTTPHFAVHTSREPNLYQTPVKHHATEHKQCAVSEKRRDSEAVMPLEWRQGMISVC